MTGSFALNLNAGQASKVNNVTWFTIAAGTTIENAVTGDGNDTITGNCVVSCAWARAMPVVTTIRPTVSKASCNVMGRIQAAKLRISLPLPANARPPDADGMMKARLPLCAQSR